MNGVKIKQKETYNENNIACSIPSKSKGFSNVAIVAAITAYARIIKDPYKRIPGNPCSYSYTDSVFLQNQLPSNFIGPQLGQKKQEDIIKEAIFVSPKLYSYINDNDVTVIKAKGFSNKVLSHQDKISQLNYQEIKLVPVKNFKNTGNYIQIINYNKQVINTLNNKRRLILIDNIVIGTDPLLINKQIL